MNIVNKIAALAIFSLSALHCTCIFAISDADLNSAVKAKIKANETTTASKINVTTNNGVVDLSGNLQTEGEANAAIEAANSISGVKDVNTDKLMVKDGTQPYLDSYITAKVKGAFVRENLLGDKPIAPLAIAVETKNGVVYLTGTVASKAQETTAINLAKAIKGVKNVESKVMINASSNE